MMLRAAEAGDDNAMVYAAVDLCFTPSCDSQLRACIEDQKRTSRSVVDAHSKGVSFLRGAVDRRNPDAAFLMATLVAEGGAGLDRNEPLAEKYFQKAEEWRAGHHE